MASQFYLHVYRRLCRVDASDHAEGTRTRRFEFLSGSEEEMRGLFDEFKSSPQTLAVELWSGGSVMERYDRLVDLLPDVDPAEMRQAVVEPPLLAGLPSVRVRRPLTLQDASEKVREYHQRYGLPVADAPQLLPMDGVKAMRLSVGLIELWTEIRSLPSIQKALMPPAAKEDLLVRFALRELDLLGQWVKAHVQGDLEGAGFAWGDRLYLLLREAVAAGLPVEQLFTLTDEVTGSEPPEE